MWLCAKLYDTEIMGRGRESGRGKIKRHDVVGSFGTFVTDGWMDGMLHQIDMFMNLYLSLSLSISVKSDSRSKYFACIYPCLSG